ncbi:MAG: PIN domain-containing protein [Firmicutes bacterium]|nr:PIN domain-containing protein [Bacillota bacterium]
MTGPALIDSNILVYAYDRSEMERSLVASDVINNLARTGLLILSSQVLAEFFVAATRRIRHPLTASEATRSVLRYAADFPVVAITGPIVREALRGVASYGLSYWDAQVWATARLNQIETIVTEDVPSQDEIEGVRYENPFEH